MSHNHADKPFVRRLATDLTKAGADIWIDEVEMKVGDSLIERIGSGISASDFLAVVLSHNSTNSAWVTQELEIALTMQISGSRIRVLPLRLDNAQLPPFLLGKLYCDFSTPEVYHRSLVDLTRAVGVTFAGSGDPDAAARWHCGYCGWACCESYNDYLCKACGAVRMKPIGTSTMVKCNVCDSYSLAIAAYCDGCGTFFGFRRV